MRRRTFLRLALFGGSAAVRPGLAFGFAGRSHGALDGLGVSAVRGASLYGRWARRFEMPAFEYAADQDSLPAAEWDPVVAPRTRRNWLMVGNRAIHLQGSNDGTVALFDETHGLRWLTAPDPTGTGVSLLDDGGVLWGTEYSMRAGETAPLRTFGPTWFAVRDSRAGLELERTVLCPEGEVAWLLVRVRLSLSEKAPPRSLSHVEHWALRPRFLNLLESPDQRRTRAGLAVAYEVGESATGLVASEIFASPSDPGAVGQAARYLIGPPATLVLERLGDTEGSASHRTDGEPHPTLEIETGVTLQPGETRLLWFRFGRQGDPFAGDPANLFDDSLRALAARVPRATARAARQAAREIPWHGALLTGGAAADGVIGGDTLDQASAYSYLVGFNGAARDPLQHALPLVYIDPDLSLSVLRNTCAWAMPNGDLPYASTVPSAPPTSSSGRPIRTSGRSGSPPNTPRRPEISPPSTRRSPIIRPTAPNRLRCASTCAGSSASSSTSSVAASATTCAS